MRYKAVGFDYGGVIGGGGLNGVDFNKQACAILDIDEPHYKKIYFSLNHLINTGKVETWHEFWKIFLEKLGKPEKLSELMILNDEYDTNLNKINKKILGLVDVLKQKGFITGLLSNNTKDMGRTIRQAGVDRHFDVFHISSETGLMKPKPEAFKHFIEELGVQPQELVFIDDAEKSLSTAEECGFTPILFESYEQLLGRLKELKILYNALFLKSANILGA